uniref:Uncharacterized protein n=1 Tax=Arundo donax TaxID=35708 RepID=A0A0A8YX71_ARUDO
MSRGPQDQATEPFLPAQPRPPSAEVCALVICTNSEQRTN